MLNNVDNMGVSDEASEWHERIVRYILSADNGDVQHSLAFRRVLKRFPPITPTPSRLQGIPTVYFFYDDADRLLYIGQTAYLSLRLQYHRRGRWWWYQVARITIEELPSRARAVERERACITNMRPAFNGASNQYDRGWYIGEGRYFTPL